MTTVSQNSNTWNCCSCGHEDTPGVGEVVDGDVGDQLHDLDGLSHYGSVTCEVN